MLQAGLQNPLIKPLALSTNRATPHPFNDTNSLPSAFPKPQSELKVPLSPNPGHSPSPPDPRPLLGAITFTMDGSPLQRPLPGFRNPLASDPDHDPPPQFTGLQTLSLSLSLIFFFWPCLWHVEVPRSRDQTRATATTQATAATTPDP